MGAGRMIIVQNEKHSMFEVEISGQLAYITYWFYKNDIVFLYTFVPERFRSLGIGSALVKTALDFAEREQKKVMPYCSFAAGYMKKHKKYRHLVDTVYYPLFNMKTDKATNKRRH